MKMRYLASIILVLAFLTHCTEGRPPAQLDGLKPTDANTTGAQKAFIDPETGEFLTPAENETPTTNVSVQPHALSNSAEEMEEEPSPVPGGGMMIDLKGRFHSPLSATIEDNGNTKIEHQANDAME
jgi:hypothetical protein